MIIFLWKISQGLFAGFDVKFASSGLRRGRPIIPNDINMGAPTAVRNARCQMGQDFNLQPESIRTMNTEHIEYFKNHLDVFLATIPDQPTTTGLGRAAETNSLIHQLPIFYAQTR